MRFDNSGVFADNASPPDVVKGACVPFPAAGTDRVSWFRDFRRVELKKDGFSSAASRWTVVARGGLYREDV